MNCFGDLKSKKFYPALLAEFIGTLFLVLCACGSALAPSVGNLGSARVYASSVVQISLGFGFSVATMVWTIAHVSGGHINPAVSFGFLVTRKISCIKFLLYVIMQLLGATVGAALLRGLTEDYDGNLGTSQLGANVTAGQGFGIECMITFVLVFTVFSCCDSGRADLQGSIPLTIGGAITMCHLWAVSYIYTLGIGVDSTVTV